MAGLVLLFATTCLGLGRAEPLRVNLKKVDLKDRVEYVVSFASLSLVDA